MSDLLARLAQEREERVQDLHLDLPIPTWDGSLVARFGILERKALEKFANAKRTPEADMDFLIMAVRELYVHDPDKQLEGGERMDGNIDYVRLEDDNGIPVKFDATLAAKLGQAELTTARDVIAYCFKQNTIATSAMALKVIQWMQNTDLQVAEALVGE